MAFSLIQVAGVGVQGASQIWVTEDLPEGLPLPVRLKALGSAAYLPAGTILTAALKRGLAAEGIAGFVEAADTPETIITPQQYFVDPVLPTGAAPATPEPSQHPTVHFAPPDQARLLKAALPQQSPGTSLDAKARGFIQNLYRRPMDQIDRWFLDTIVEEILAWTATLPGPPALPGHIAGAETWLADHVFDSALWVAWLGQQFGLPQDELTGAVNAALLRDIGQLACDPQILYDKSALDPRAKNQVHNHPIFTIGWLEQNHITSEPIHRTIRQHHECFDGTGYPLQLPASLLSQASQLLALTDTFIAVSSPRPHREAKSLHAAIQAVVQGAGTKFDPALTKFFLQKVGQYPVGSLLMLDGKIPAVVTEGSGKQPWRPTVQLVARCNGSVEMGPTVDLAQQPSRITQVLR